MQDESKEKGLFIGGPTILMVLIVLCFSVFALIALASAEANKVFAERTAQSVEAYYRASSEATALIGRLTVEAGNCAMEERSARFTEFLDEVGVVNVYDPEKKLITFCCSAGEGKTLEVDLRLEPSVEIARFQITANTFMGEEEAYLPLM